MIAASAVSAVALLVILLTLFFGYKRYQRRKVSAYIDKITSGHNTAIARARLLDGEDMDMGDNWSSHYRDNSGSGSWRGAATAFHLPFTARNMSTRSLSASITSQHTTNTQNSATAPHLLRARGSETGSIFHEGVWPPPGEESRLVDPLIKASGHVDLSRIVDDIMGSSNEQIRQGGAGYTNIPNSDPTSQPHTHSEPSGSEFYLMRQDTLPPPYTRTHNRTDSATSSYTHSRDGSATSQTGLLTPLPLGAAQPKKSSPLAQNTAMGTSSTGDQRNSADMVFGNGPSTIHWLKRSPRNHHPGLDNGT